MITGCMFGGGGGKDDIFKDQIARLQWELQQERIQRNKLQNELREEQVKNGILEHELASSAEAASELKRSLMEFLSGGHEQLLTESLRSSTQEHYRPRKVMRTYAPVGSSAESDDFHDDFPMKVHLEKARGSYQGKENNNNSHSQQPQHSKENVDSYHVNSLVGSLLNKANDLQSRLMISVCTSSSFQGGTLAEALQHSGPSIGGSSSSGDSMHALRRIENKQTLKYR